MNYADSIIYLQDGPSKLEFPKRFSNQVYISSLKNMDSFSYKSNFSIKFTACGEEKFIVNNCRRLVGENQFLIVNNGSQVESEKSGKESADKAMSIFIDPDIVSEVFQTLSASENDVPLNFFDSTNIGFYETVNSDDQKFIAFLRSLMNYHPDAIMDESFYYTIAENLYYFNLRLEKKMLRLNKVKRSTRLEIFRRIDIAQQFLKDNYNRNFDLDEVSQVACMAKFFFIRNFKLIHGVTPQKYHLNGRMEKAKKLLEKEYSVTETAASLGFTTIHYFSQQFKKWTGSAPSIYGKNRI